jgi:hypothetical protein
MQLPLELLWDILVFYEQENSTKELLHLRLVSSKLNFLCAECLENNALTYPQESLNHQVLSKVFTSHRRLYEECIINPQSWSKMPWSLKQQYLRYKIARFENEPTFFAYVLIPVMELTMKARGITEDDLIGKENTIDDLLEILKHFRLQGTARFLHQHSDFEFIADKELEILSRMTARDFPTGETCRKKLRDASTMMELRTASICCAVLKNDVEAFRSALGTISFDISMPSMCFETDPLSFTFRLGTDAMVDFLLGHCQPESMYESYCSIVNDLSRDSKRKRTLQILLRHVAKMGSVEPRSSFLRMIFREAVNMGSFDFIDEYLGKLEHFHIPKDGVWRNTLETAVERSRPDIFNRVLDDVTAEFLTVHQSNLLYQALGRYGLGSPNIQITETLLEKGIDPNSVLIDDDYNTEDKYEQQILSFYDDTVPTAFIEKDKTITPLQVVAAVRRSATEIIRLLLEHGADVNGAQGTKKIPPVFLAAEYGSVEAIRALLKGGANPRGTFQNKAFLEYADGGTQMVAS